MLERLELETEARYYNHESEKWQQIAISLKQTGKVDQMEIAQAKAMQYYIIAEQLAVFLFAAWPGVF